MKPVTVQVTARHIAQARPNSVRDSPIALAMSEATGHACCVNSVSVQVPGRFHATPPGWLLSLMEGFDRFGVMEPFAFVLSGGPGARRILTTEEAGAQSRTPSHQKAEQGRESEQELEAAYA